MDHDTEARDEHDLPQARFRTLVDHAPMGIALADTDGTIIHANRRWRDLAGFDGDLPASALTMLALIHPDDRSSAVAAFSRAATDEGEVRRRVRIGVSEGEVRHVTIAVTAIPDESGRVTSYAVGLSDVTELVHALEEVRLSEARFRSVTQALPVGVFRADRDGKLFWANDRMSEISGFEVEAAKGASVFGFTHPDDQEKVYVRAQNALAEQIPLESTHRFVSRDGSVKWVISRATAIIDEGGRILEHVGTIEDITELHLRSEGYAHRSRHDPLTGLPNRASLEDLISDLCAQRPGRSDIGLVFIDLDRFKEVNDTSGHQAGDEVLKEVGRRLSSVIRTEDVVGRYGGDEFVVICPGVSDAAVLEQVAERIRCAIRDTPFRAGDRSHAVGASVGTALGPSDQTPDAFLHAADVAMYDAKRSRDRSQR